MSIAEIMGLEVDVTADTSKFIKQLNDAASDISIGFDPKELIKGFVSAKNDIRKLISDTVSAGAEAGFSLTSIKALDGKFKGISESIDSRLTSIYKLQVRGATDAANVWTDAQKEDHKRSMEGEKKKLSQLHKRLGLEKKASERIMDRRKKAMAEADRLASRTRGEIGKETGEGILGAFNKLKGGDIGGLLSSAGKGMTARGTGMKDKAKVGGKLGGMMGKLGGMMAEIGPIIAGLGAIVAGFAALVAIVVAVDSVVKGLNKHLMDSGVAGADMADQYNQLGDTLEKLRKATTRDYGFNQMWGTSGKDLEGIIGSFDIAGRTIHEMGTEMDRLQKYTSAALTYSKLLGLTTQEVSSSMSVYMEELGMTLQGVRGHFSNITAAAKESGFGVKRFFNMVLQATSGMSMYNVRLEEAAGLLLQLGDILGEKMGGDFLHTLMKGFKDEGTQDSIKKTMMMGVGESSKLYRKQAVISASDFDRLLKELTNSDDSKEKDEGAKIKALLEKLDLHPSSESFAKDLSKLPMAKIASLQNEIAGLGTEGPGVGRNLRALWRQSQVYKGGVAGASAARATAGPGAVLWSKIHAMDDVADVGSLTSIAPTDFRRKMAYENATGISGEEYQRTLSAGLQMDTRYKNMLAASKGTVADREAFNKAEGDETGVTLDTETGVAYRKDATGQRGAEIKGAMDYYLGVGSNLLDNEDAQMSEDTQLAKEIAKNTTSLASILERGVEYFLSGIYDSVQSIAGMMGSGLSGEERKSKTKVIIGLSKNMDDARKRSYGIVKEMDALKDERHGANPERQKEIDTELAAKSKDVKLAEITIRSLGRKLRAAQRFQAGGGWFGLDRTSEQIRATGEEGDKAQRRKDLNKSMSDAEWQEEIVGPAAAAVKAKGKTEPHREGGFYYGGIPLTTQKAEEDRLIDGIIDGTQEQTTELSTTIGLVAPAVIDGNRRISQEEMQRQVVGFLGEAGITEDLNSMAGNLLHGVISPELDLNVKVSTGKTLGNALLGVGSSGMSQAVMGAMSGPAAQDFLMQIGQGGRVKFAQRISASDTVTAVASKPGGPIQSSGRGAGGSTIVVNSFGNAAEVIRGIQAAVAAGVI